MYTHTYSNTHHIMLYQYVPSSHRVASQPRRARPPRESSAGSVGVRESGGGDHTGHPRPHFETFPVVRWVYLLDPEVRKIDP